MAVIQTLTDSQVQTLQSLLDDNNYSEAYIFIENIVTDEHVKDWFDIASHIVADDGTFYSDFVRTSTINYSQTISSPITEEQFQNAANQLADSIISEIISSKSISDIETIVYTDAKSAVDNLGLNIEGWAGVVVGNWYNMFGGLGLESDGDFYDALYNDWKERGIDQWSEQAAAWAYLTANNSSAFFSTSPVLIKETYNSVKNFLDRFGDVESSKLILGNDLTDYLVNDGDSLIYSYGGNDTIDVSSNNNLIDGGEGNDTISYVLATKGVDVDMGAANTYFINEFTGSPKDIFDNIENIIGSSMGDVILGDQENNVLEGRDGDDEIDGSHGDDIIIGGAGSDILSDAEGFDRYIFNNTIVDGTTRGYGQDTISDSDKQGQIEINGQTITGTAVPLDEGSDITGLYQITIGQNRYLLNKIGSDLIIINESDLDDAHTAQNKITIKDYQSGDLGIDIPGDDNAPVIGIDKVYVGTSGDDSFSSHGENSLIYAGGGNDSISNTSHTIVFGGDGNDVIRHGYSSIINPGKGDDLILSTSFSNDNSVPGMTYIYNKGDGKDRIRIAGGDDTLKLGDGINKDDLSFVQEIVNNNYSSNIIIRFQDNDADEIKMESYLLTTIDRKIETIEFTDGSIIDMEARDFNISIYGDNGGVARNDYFQGLIHYKYDIKTGQGNDGIQLYGGNDDIIEGGTGDDTINGASGNDVYIYNKGDGHDEIGDAGGSDIIRFTEGISLEDLYFSQPDATAPYPNSLYIHFKDTPDDSISIANYFSADNYKIETLEFADGSSVLLSDLDPENSTYFFNNGDTYKRIHDPFGDDKIIFGDEFNADDIYLLDIGSNNQLHVLFQNSTAQIQLVEYFLSDHTIENFEFSDGSVLDTSDIKTLGSGSTTGNDYLYFYDNNVNYYVDSKEGDDYIRTADGDDVIIAGAGNDELDARAGNNTLTGGEGSDIFVITKTASAARLTAQTTSSIETDTITDFDLSAQGDKIDLSDFSTRIYFSELNIYQDGNNAIIDFGNQQVILENIDYTQLNQTHFTGILQEHEIHAGVLDDVIEDYRVDGASYYDSYRIYGYDGDDIINGITGRNNVIDGGAGNDILITRDATLTGGEGSDIFKFSYFVDEYQNSNNVITDFDVSDPNEKIVLEATDITDFSQLSITDSAQGAVITYTAYNYWGFYDATNSITLQGVSASDLTADHFEISTLVDTSGSGEYVDYSSYNTPFHTSGYGGSGTVLTGSGEDFVYIEDGSYDIDSGAGNDTIYSWGGNDTIYSGTGDDEIILTYSSSSHIMTVHGQEDNDHFYIDSSSYGFHELHGGQGADSFELHANNAQINGDAGDDLINLYDGTNVVVNAGGDHDVVNVYADAQGSIISGDAGNDLFVIRSTDNSSTIVDFEIDNPNEKIDFQFLDITYADLQITQSGADAVISYTGFSGNVILTDTDATQLTQDNFIFKHTGTNVDDTITTNNYNNVIAADDGKDTITISGMENEIAGGTGDDQFIITKLAKSQTTITDFDVDNTNETIDLSQFEVSSVSDLYIYNKDNDAYVNLGNEQVLILKNVTKEALRDANFIFNTNTAPIINNPIADQENKSNNIFNFAIAADAFIDADGDSLTYSATLADGSSLPDWLSFNAETQTFTGTPPSSLIDSALSLMIIADDGLLQTSQVFNLTITSNIIEGTNANDNFRGTIDNDELYGLAGNDVIRGARGNDKIFGGDGRDHLIGGGDADELHGGNGRDLLKGNKGNDKLYGGMGKDSLFGGNGHDELYGQEADDLLIGNHGQDILHGGAGNDDIRGGKHQDHLYGQEGNDTLRGGKGSDHINGGQGQDILIGGNGHDFFVFDSLSHSNSLHPDIIKDFQQTKDLIDLSNLGFDGITNDDSQTDDSLLTYTHNGNNTIIENEDQTFAITMKGIFELDSDDFFFS